MHGTFAMRTDIESPEFGARTIAPFSLRSDEFDVGDAPIARACSRMWRRAVARANADRSAKSAALLRARQASLVALIHSTREPFRRQLARDLGTLQSNLRHHRAR